MEILNIPFRLFMSETVHQLREGLYLTGATLTLVTLARYSLS
jgi:hypothetical protein